MRIVVAWIAFIPVAVINGIAREAIIKRFVGDLAAHQISTVTISVAFLALAYFTLRSQADGLRTSTLFLIGAVWVLMTVCFEFGVGRYVSGRTWEWLLQDYNVLKGRVWGLFVLFTLFAPYLAKALAGLASRR